MLLSELDERSYDDHLEHFGVLGMKWGHRKGREGVSPATKRYEKKLAGSKLSSEKRTTIETKLKTSKARDKQLNEYVKSVSTGKAVARSMLASPYGNYKYASLRSQGVSKGKAVAKTILAANLNFASAGLVGFIDKRRV